MEKKRKYHESSCEECKENFIGLTEKQAERYKQMHKCTGGKEQ